MLIQLKNHPQWRRKKNIFYHKHNRLIFTSRAISCFMPKFGGFFLGTMLGYTWLKICWFLGSRVTIKNRTLNYYWARIFSTLGFDYDREVREPPSLFIKQPHLHLVRLFHRHTGNTLRQTYIHSKQTDIYRQYTDRHI